MVIGLTGGIATGKSVVAAELKRLGAHIIDADLVAREIVRPNEPAYSEIVREFGEGILKDDRTLDRKALGRIVFSDKEKRERLNSITHPRILERIKAETARLEREYKDPVIVVDIALLIELKLQASFSAVIVVFCDEAQQVERMVKRDGLSEAEARERLSSQMPVKEKLEYADYPIDNSGRMDETLKRAGEVWRELKGLKNVKKGT